MSSSHNVSDASTSDLDVLVPMPVELEAGGETLLIKPLKIGQLPAFLRAVTPVMQQLQGTEIDWLTLFAEHGDNVLAAMAIALAKPRAWVDALPADEAIVLAARVIEVNADFFTRSVIPKISGAFNAVRLGTAPTPAGST